MLFDEGHDPQVIGSPPSSNEKILPETTNTRFGNSGKFSASLDSSYNRISFLYFYDKQNKINKSISKTVGLLKHSKKLVHKKGVNC